MPMLPMSYRDWIGQNDTPFRSARLDQHQHFGTKWRPEFLAHETLPLRTSYYRPWQTHVFEKEHAASTVKVDKDAYQVVLDVQQFDPEEITVRTVDNHIIVQGKHDEKQDDHGFVSRHFTRRYTLPEGHDPNGVVAMLSSDGVLTVSTPKKKEFPPSPERNVHITQTREPATEHPKETVMEQNQ